jgi:hypothetical protein
MITIIDIMERKYYGDIEGKFWFGSQESNDIEKLCNIEKDEVYCWKVCNCLCNNEDIDIKGYCSNCFDSYNIHLDILVNDERTMFSKDNSLCIYYKINDYKYIIEKDKHYDEILKTVLELESIIDLYTFELKIEINYYNIIKKEGYEETSKNNKLVSRYCFGKLILNYLNYHNICCVYCQF